MGVDGHIWMAGPHAGKHPHQHERGLVAVNQHGSVTPVRAGRVAADELLRQRTARVPELAVGELRPRGRPLRHRFRELARPALDHLQEPHGPSRLSLKNNCGILAFYALERYWG